MDYPHWLLAAFSLFWIVLAIRPRDRAGWKRNHVDRLVHLGSQGDEWDAQEGNAMATGGSIVATGVVAILT